MTEDSPPKDDDYLVRVKAQVMCRDDSSGGWVPLGGGGMSIVGIRKVTVPTPEDLRHEYLIHGQKIYDQAMVLNCVLRKDLTYNQATPTFHHWKTEEKRFGLTFQSSVDAGAFHKGIKRALEDLLEDSPDSSNLQQDIGDDDVFMPLDLPLRRKDSGSQSASTASTTTSSPTPQSPAVSVQDPFNNNSNCQQSSYNSSHHLHRVHYIPRQQRHPISNNETGKSSSKSSSESNGKNGGGGGDDLWGELVHEKRGSTGRSKPHHHHHQGLPDDCEIVDNSYVQFSKGPSGHEYSYPNLENTSKSSQRRDSVSCVKKQAITQQPPLPTKMPKGKKGIMARKDRKRLLSKRSSCVYCNQMFSYDDNFRGSCQDAPDCAKDCIEYATCVCCTRFFFYHFLSDQDGYYGHPCMCDSSDDSNTKKWIAMTILSIFFPCLWCYWPLAACHRCGMACNCCGGRHKAQ